MYRRVITPSAKRSLKRLPIQTREDLIIATEILETVPYSGKKLSGLLYLLYSFHFKSRGIEYRVGYTIDNNQRSVIIHFAGTRENFYKRLERLFK